MEDEILAELGLLSDDPQSSDLPMTEEISVDEIIESPALPQPVSQMSPAQISMLLAEQDIADSEEEFLRQAREAEYQDLPLRRWTRPVDVNDPNWSRQHLQGLRAQSLPRGYDRLNPENLTEAESALFEDELRAKGTPVPYFKKTPATGSTPPITEGSGTPGLDQAMAQLRRRAGIQRKLGDLDSQIVAGRADYGTGNIESVQDARVRINQEFNNKAAVYADEFEEDYEDAQLTARYPGMSLQNIKDDMALLSMDTTDFSEKGAAEYLRLKAQAKKRLEKAQEINPNRAFNNAGSKILASLALGAGTWASARTGTKNVALDLYKTAIANDISAQKDMFNQKRKAPGQARGEFAFFMNKLGNEQAATLATAATKYDQAISSLKGQSLKLKSQDAQAALMGQVAQLQMQKDKIAQAAKQAAVRAKLASETSIPGMSYTGSGIERKELEVKARKDLQEKAAAYADVRGQLETLARVYEDISKVPLIGQKERTKFKLAREDLIAKLGVVWGKGVLQEFERKQIEAVIPGANESFEKQFFDSDRIKAMMDQFNEAEQNSYKAYADGNRYFNYNPPGSSISTTPTGKREDRR
jgi:hypothetical protein